jgi:hypothetical protein
MMDFLKSRKKIRVDAYKLKLPEWLKLHLAFHGSYFRPFHEDQEDQNEVSRKKLL